MPENLSFAFWVVDMVGVVLNGIIGGSIAKRRHFDLIGFVVLAVLSALGGGAIRDVLLMSGRPLAVQDPTYLMGAIAGAFLAFVLNLKGRAWNTFYRLADAIVLGAWAATGTAKALGLGVHWLPALMMGLVTAVGGGMIRDISAGMIPHVFGGNNLYATPALLASLIVLAGYQLQLGHGVVLIAATIAGAALAMAADAWGLRLPIHGDGTYTRAREKFGATARWRRGTARRARHSKALARLRLRRRLDREADERGD